jgi:hypothetical protein
MSNYVSEKHVASILRVEAKQETGVQQVASTADWLID